MPTLTQRESIVLGKVLEQCIEPMLFGYTVLFSESYETLLTRPDYMFIVDDQKVASMAVTCTQNNECMVKKRWRYIDEVCQLKSYFGPSFITINCEFGDESTFVQSEKDLTDSLFDASIYVYDFNKGPEFLDVATKLVKTRGLSTKQVVSELCSHEYWVVIRNQMRDRINTILAARLEIASKNPLKAVWDDLHTTFSQDYLSAKETHFEEVSAYLRYTVLNGLLLGRKMEALISATKENLPIEKDMANAFSEAGFIIGKRIGGFFVEDPKLIGTVQYGFTFNIFQEIEETLFSSEALLFALQDIQEDGRIAHMVEITIPLLEEETLLENALYDAFINDNYCGIAHDRVWMADVILAYLQISRNYLNRLYTQVYGRKGLATVFEHYATKTAMGRSLFADLDYLREFCSNLSKLIIQEKSQLESVPKAGEVIERYRTNKIQSIGNQRLVNPVQRYIEVVFKNLELDYSKDSITSALTNLPGVPTSMSNIHEVYQIEINGKKIFIKGIAADKGVKDKTREMAARGRLLQYYSRLGEKRDVDLVFVFDGTWTKELKQLLRLSGWKHIVPILDLESFLKNQYM